jgi:hypothetical protein
MFFIYCYKIGFKMECLVLKRRYKDHKGLIECWQYFIANGMAMGKWTLHFGVHCLADTYDTKEYLKIQHEEGKTVMELHEVNFKTVL